jgi:hypothetical protein
MKNKTIEKIKNKMKKNKLIITELKICNGLQRDLKYRYYKLDNIDDVADIKRLLNDDDDWFCYYILQFEIILKNKFYNITKEDDLFIDILDYYLNNYYN